MKTFNEKVYEVIEKIPYGMVLSYGQVAELAGSKRSARMVGYALHALRSGAKLPWHRVVFKDGSLACLRGDNMQYNLLRGEGVSFNRHKRVKMEKYTWDAVEIMLNL